MVQERNLNSMKTILIIIPVISVGLGWLLNEFSHWLNSRKDDSKIKKQVLFNLLELRFQLHKLKYEKFIDALTDIAVERIPINERPENIKDIIKEMYVTSLNQIIEENVNQSLLSVELQYDKAINELSSVDPVGAFRLFGKNKMTSQSNNAFDTYSENLSKSISFEDDEELIKESLKEVKKTMKPEMISDLISDIEEEILRLSKSISFKTHRETKSILKKPEQEISKEQKAEIEKLLDKLEAIAKRKQTELFDKQIVSIQGVDQLFNPNRNLINKIQ